MGLEEGSKIGLKRQANNNQINFSDHNLCFFNVYHNYKVVHFKNRHVSLPNLVFSIGSNENFSMIKLSYEQKHFKKCLLTIFRDTFNASLLQIQTL